MPANYVLLSEVTVGAAGAASVTMANIPQSGYTDLKIVSSTRTDRASQVADWVKISFNGSTSSFSLRELEGNGSAAASYTGTTGLAFFAPASTATANTFGNSEVYIPNYTSSNYKSYSADTVTENNATSANAAINAGLWSNTAAITSISFTPNLGTNFVANSTFYLYGLAAVGTTPVIAPFASGGDVITNDGTYWIHTFLSSGTFTPAKALTCDALVIAGGGGGNTGYAGGGAGGYRTTIGGTPLSVTAIPYSVTVGSGGPGGAAQNGNPPTAANGTSSIFSSITTSGGGGGGGGATGSGAGAAGGSGGGGSPGAAGGAGNTGSYSPVEGYAGGNGYANNPVYIGGGGGGAGAAGGASSGSVAGAGGAGLASSITGTSVMRGGGGGATALYNSPTSGAGGAGGGGAGGAALTAGTSGTANTGGGGGAGAVDPSSPNNRGGGNGGSGVVIIRYPMV